MSLSMIKLSQVRAQPCRGSSSNIGVRHKTTNLLRTPNFVTSSFYYSTNNTNNAGTADAMVNEVMERAVKAQKIYATYDQERVDRIVHAVALAATKHRIPLAQLAVHETKRGVIEDKVIKNHFAAENILTYCKNIKTCEADDTSIWGYVNMPEPHGTVAFLTPVTNPTSTVIYKALMLLKTRNAGVLCAHPNAFECSTKAATIIHDAAVEAGAPPNILSWFPQKPTRSQVHQVMQHEQTDFIWATGGGDMVQAAKSTGKLGLLAGPGNCPALIDEFADLDEAVSSILHSKCFDYGMICAAEQTIVAVRSIYDRVKLELERRGAMLLNEHDSDLLRKAMRSPDGGLHIHKDMVGSSPQKIGMIAGFEVPSSVRALVVEAKELDPSIEPLVWEKMSPILGLYCADDFEHSLSICKALVEFGGVGHAGSIHTNAHTQQERVKMFQKSVPAGVVLVNQPTSFGMIGDVYNFKMIPRLSIPTGSGCTGVSLDQLMKYRTISNRVDHHLWVHLPKMLFEKNCTPFALKRLAETSEYKVRDASAWRVAILSDRSLERVGYVHNLQKMLVASSHLPVAVEMFLDIEADPGFTTILSGLEILRTFKPHTIIALGGGSVMDAAKVMRLVLDHPEVSDIDGLKLRFLDITKRVFTFPSYREHKENKSWVTDVTLVCIPTTSGTGSEVSPFAVVTDPRDGVKYPICSYSMTPQMAIIDPIYAESLPPSLIAAPGYDTLVHAVESYTSVLSSEFTRPYSLHALKLIVGENHLMKSLNGDMKSRAAVHKAATLAGAAIANAFVGIGHSIAHQFGAKYHIPHGIACAITLPHIMRFNATDAPAKQATFPQFLAPDSSKRYADLAIALFPNEASLIPSTDHSQLVSLLISKFVKLRADLGIPNTLLECGVTREVVLNDLDEIALHAFDDQCTGSNPRFPLISELKDIILQCCDNPN